MIPVQQTIFGKDQGNCFQACLASIFELPLDRVPHVILEEDWEAALEDWLIQFNLYYILAEIPQCRAADWWPEGYHLIGGTCSTGVYHSVVGYKGEMVWDPHPLQPGLEVEETWRIFARRFEIKKDY